MVTNQSSRTDLTLLVLRFVFAIILFAHGAQKLFVFGFSGVTAAFAQMNVPAPHITGPLIALLEFLAPIALFVGLFTRLAALALMGAMTGAIVFVHLKNGFFNPSGVEFPLALAAGLLGLAIAGAGKFSVDGRLAARRQRA